MRYADGFRAVYEEPGVYDSRLLPHYFDGREDTELVGAVLGDRLGRPQQDLRVVEFGCGSGRITPQLAPYASTVLLADNSRAMIDDIHRRFPAAQTLCADTRDTVEQLLHERGPAIFDLVGAFWTLNYPLGEIFETLTARGIEPVHDPGSARRTARAFILDLVRLLAVNGLLVTLYFDDDTPEQRLVTRLWERIAPFPEEDRGYTRHLFLDTLQEAEHSGAGQLQVSRLPGIARAENAATATDWFNVVHLKSHPTLVHDSSVQHEIDTLVRRHTQADGSVALPTGVYVIEFRRSAP